MCLLRFFLLALEGILVFLVEGMMEVVELILVEAAIPDSSAVIVSSVAVISEEDSLVEIVEEDFQVVGREGVRQIGRF